MATKKTVPFSFEESLAALDKIVADMESGSMPLETALTHFEEGVQLIRRCQQALSDAELKVKQLTESGGKFQLSEFKHNDDETL
jgi:exodeoxyribonuclease VII small subunit